MAPDKSQRQLVRIVDLFCGAGGLSLGFELHRGNIDFQIAMALDVNPAAVRVYNANRDPSPFPTARICDLTWFSHSSEALLYYLVHLAHHEHDESLLNALDGSTLDVPRFLKTIRALDAEFDQVSARLAATPAYVADFANVDDRTFHLAIAKTFVRSLGLSSLRMPLAAPRLNPWRDEGTYPDADREPFEWRTIPSIEAGLRSWWDQRVAELAASSAKAGHGQHVVVGGRLRTLVAFLNSPSGKELRQVWLKWRGMRDSVRAKFCLDAFPLLQELYTQDRRVQLILGGPPCKGFSRIGRAVIESLRDQGVHAWSSHEYGDERNALLHKYVLFLEALRPRAFVFENVAHFQSSLRTPSGQLDAPAMLSEAIEQLSRDNLRYDISSSIVRAKRHGIPQDRERFLMVGLDQAAAGEGSSSMFFNLRSFPEEVPLQLALQGLDKPIEFTSVESESGATRTKLVRGYTLVDPGMPEAHQRFVQWIRQPQPGRQRSPENVDAHIVRRPRSDDLALIEKFAPGQRWMDYKVKQSQTLDDIRLAIAELRKVIAKGSRGGSLTTSWVKDLERRIDDSLVLRLILEDHPKSGQDEEGNHLLSSDYLSKGTDRHGDWFQRLAADRPCKTVVAHIGKDTYGYIHPYENRALSIREAARVQSFPDFFCLSAVGVVESYSLIGDAVPPLLAKLLAERMEEIDAEWGVFSDTLPASTPIRGTKQLSMQL